MPKANHTSEVLPRKPRAEAYFSRVVRGPFIKLLSRGFRRLQYPLLILLCAATALALYDAVGAVWDPDAQVPWGWLQVGIRNHLAWLITLAPAAILMVIMGGLRAQRSAVRIIWLSVGVICASIVGIVLKDYFLYGATTAWLLGNSLDVLAASSVIALPAAFLVAIYEFHSRGLEAAEAALKVQTDRITMEAELSKARLRLLRAQIEPHFIFNSLAHVRRLYQVEPVKGHQMLASLIRYFASAFPSLRQETCSLNEEAALIDAYLNIHRLRMGSRLAYDVVFPANLLDLQIPTMVLLTLVENAIKHGLSPLPEGGYIRISAWQIDNVLELRVADSGRGLAACSGPGTGLANIRARLNALYGSSAALRLSINQPRGITAAVCLPISQLVAR